MNNQSDLCSLDQVLDAYLSVSKIPNQDTLKDWIQRFPEYEIELIDFTIAWSDIENSPLAFQSKNYEDSFLAIGKKLVSETFYLETINERIKTKMAIRSFFTEGKNLGISPGQLSDQLNLSLPLLRRIDLRHFLFDTIPLFFMESLSNTIKRSVREIACFLSEKPLIPKTVRFRSQHIPRLTEQRNFFDEVSADATLTEEQREYWLSYKVT